MADTADNTLRNSQGVAAEQGLRSLNLCPTGADNLVYLLDPDRRYGVKHLSRAADGTASTNRVKYAFAKTPTLAAVVDATSNAAAMDTAFLNAGETDYLPPSVGILKLNAHTAGVLMAVFIDTRNLNSTGG